MSRTAGKRILSAKEVEFLREIYGNRIDEFEGILDPPVKGSEDYSLAQDMRAELNACDSLEHFLDISWCHWGNFIHELDVDGYLGDRDFNLDSEVDEKIVKFVFHIAYGIETSD
jgi:hypothetical protein